MRDLDNGDFFGVGTPPNKITGANAGGPRLLPMRARHKAEFFGVPATGRPVRLWGVVIDRLEGGKIKDTRIIMDAFGLMVQLGVFQPTKA